jgi:hypothetical protein
LEQACPKTTWHKTREEMKVNDLFETNIVCYYERLDWSRPFCKLSNIMCV